jgi:hypothetical protein
MPLMEPASQAITAINARINDVLAVSVNAINGAIKPSNQQ